MAASDTSVIEQLRAIWMEALDLQAVADDDDFLNLGGDSQTALRCQQRVAALFNVQLPRGVLLVEASTLQSVAARISTLVGQHDHDFGNPRPH